MNPESPQDINEVIARMKAISDQAKEGLAEVAVALAVYYRTLVDNGVPEELAGALVIDYHRLQLMQNMVDDVMEDDDG